MGWALIRNPVAVTFDTISLGMDEVAVYTRQDICASHHVDAIETTRRSARVQQRAQRGFGIRRPRILPFAGPAAFCAGWKRQDSR